MTRFPLKALAVIGLAGVLTGASSRAADGPRVEGKAAFARLKSLAGEWKVTHGEQPPGKIIYRVTSNGSAVMETLFPGTDHEMISMYHLDGDDLRMTHYCAAGNQPRMKLDKAASKPDDYRFVFDGGTNLDPAKDMHMHSGRIAFRDADHVESEWDGYVNGKKSGTTKFALSRQ